MWKRTAYPFRRPGVERLEQRLVLSAAPALSAALDMGSTGLPDPLLLNAGFDWSMVISNVGDAAAVGSAKVTCFIAYPDAKQAYPRTLATLDHLNLAPGDSVHVDLGRALSMALPIDSFFLPINLESNLKVPDAVTSDQQVAYLSVRTAEQFGQINGRNVTATSIDARTGAKGTARLTGGGSAMLQGLPGGAQHGGMDLTITGTNDRSQFRVGRSQAGQFHLTTVHVNGPLAAFIFPGALQPDAPPHLAAVIPTQFVATGAIGRISMGSPGSDLEIGPAAGRIRQTRIDAGSLGNVSSAVPISILAVREGIADFWSQLPAVVTVTAPSIDRLLVKGGLSQVHLDLTDPSATWSIRAAVVDAIVSSEIRVAGSIGSLRIGRVEGSSIFVGVPANARAVSFTPRELVAGKLLGSIVVGSGLAASRFVNTVVVAPAVGSIDVGGIDPLSPSGGPDGFLAATVRLYRRRGPAGVKLANLRGPRIWDSLGDYSLSTV